MNGTPPEPVANPSADWVERYAAWYEGEPTPSSKWHANGEPDPHGDRYDCERSELIGGQYTDDELANAQYLVDGQLVTQTMVKDRMRWLSRQLEKAHARIAELEA